MNVLSHWMLKVLLEVWVQQTESEVGMILSSFAMHSELAKQKLHFMEKDDQWQEDEHNQEKHKVLLEERKKIQSNIWALHQDLHDNTLDNATKVELEGDIPGLVQRKNQLAVELGLK